MFDIEKVKNNLSLNITSVFLELLFYDELIKNNSAQIEQTIDQVAIAKELVNSGIKTESYLLDFFTQMAQDSLNLVVSKNAYQSKLIDLIQLLDIKDTHGFDIIIPKNLKLLPKANKAVDDYYNIALTVLPEIKSAQYRLQNAESNVKYIKGNRLPSLSFEGYCGTNYSSNSTLFNQHGEAIDYLYYNQLNDNINMYFGLRLTIPIFSRFSIRNSVNIAKINSSKMATNIQLTKQNVYQEVQKVYYDFIAAKEQMMFEKKLLDASELSFYHANEKLKAGIISVYDYGTVKTQLIKVTSKYLQAKYKYIFKMKMLDFYTGVPISLEN
ncbi:TolC family protein [Halosquirtibacter laminarini]|uniref:TolC family protein n=1 Tax=Halosquirtibacter laminarini TaxID=3374600 RepID=A0AC61NHD7_9BACT|nr:TolC family protein [Prolixibacteraceae bacterium]